MSAQDWVLVIGACVAGATSLIGAVFAGFIALKQNPRQDAAAAVREAKLDANTAITLQNATPPVVINTDTTPK